MSNASSTIRWTARALFMLACLAAPALSHAQGQSGPDDKLDTVVRDALQSGRSVRAIVRFKSNQDRLRGSNIVNGRGGHVRRQHNDVGALTVDIDSSTINALAYDLGVAGISVDADVYSDATPESVQRPANRPSGAKNVRDTFNRRGRGVSIAVIDSGVQPHVDLPASRIRKFVDFVNGRTKPYDDFGHGTHVAGIAAGSGVASAGQEQPYVGVAPNADIVALKVLDASGAGKTSTVLEALEWVAANHRTYNIKVVNLSLGHPVYEAASRDPLVRAAEALVRRGIVVVASAGNMGINPTTGKVGFGGVTSPANGQGLIAVGAVDNQDTESRSDDTVTNYSSRGPTRYDFFLKPDLVASGHQTVSLSAPGSTLFEKYPALHVTAGTEAVAAYMILSGTSMAAPVVAGAAALVFETNAGLSAHAVRALLEFTSQDMPGVNALTQGAGYLNAFGAVRLAAIIRPSAPLGSLWLTQRRLPGESDELFGEEVAWGKQVIWGRRMLLGNSAYVRMAAWKDRFDWGGNLDSMVWGNACDPSDKNCDNVVWGNGCDPTDKNCDNVVWGNACDPADPKCDNVVWGNACNPADPNCDNVVWGNACNPADPNCDNVVWGNDCPASNPNCDNVVWGNECPASNPNCDNVVWGNDCPATNPNCDNVVWGNLLWDSNGNAREYWASNTVWGFWASSVNWTDVNFLHGDNVVWGNDYYNAYVLGENVVWGNTCVPPNPADCDDNVVWGNSFWILTGGGF